LIVGNVNTVIKRFFDLVLTLVLLPILITPTAILVLLATLDTKEWGVFAQKRVGKSGNLFKIYKIRTLKNEPHILGHLDKSATKIQTR